MRGGVAQYLIAAILATMVVFVIADLAGGIGDFPNAKWASAIAMICLAVWIGPGALARYRGNGGAMLKAIAIWLVIACAVALIYIYGHDELASLGFNV